MEKFEVKVVKSGDDGQQVVETATMSKPKIVKLLNEVVPVEDRWLWLWVDRNDDGALNKFEVRYYGNVTDEQRSTARTVFEGNDEVLNILTFKEQRKYGKKASTVVPEVVVQDEVVEDSSPETEVVEIDDEVDEVEVEDVEE